MTKDEALNHALEALDGLSEPYDVLKAQDAIKEALAQPDQYAKGDADAMNWKVQNHIEHLPAAQKLAEWKLVPIKPTEEMLKAMDECSTEGYDERLLAGHAASVYMAAVDVAPTPPQRPWVGLTDEEIVLIVAECSASHQHTDIHFARAIEAKLKEKNHD